MIIRQSEMQKDYRPQMRGGQGEVEITHLVHKDKVPNHVRLVGKITLPKGASIGYHVHEGETEVFYFLAGKGVANDNGTEYEVTAGDVLVTSNCGHAVVNTGEEPFELFAVIVKD